MHLAFDLFLTFLLYPNINFVKAPMDSRRIRNGQKSEGPFLSLKENFQSHTPCDSEKLQLEHEQQCTTKVHLERNSEHPRMPIPHQVLVYFPQLVLPVKSLGIRVIPGLQRILPRVAGVGLP